MDPATQTVLSSDLVAKIEHGLVSDDLTEQWKARMREAYAAGDVARIMRLLRPTNRIED